MKKSSIYIIILVVVFGVLFFVTFYNNQNPPETSEGITVAATIFPLYDITKNIGGKNIEVALIVPPGANEHTFEARPSDIQKVQKSKLTFAIGHGLDNWVLDLAGEKSEIIFVDENIELQPFRFEEGHEDGEDEHEGEDEDDPHYWLSASNAKIIARNIKNNLIAIDPQNSLEYENNFSEYLEKLDELETELKTILAFSEPPKMIVFHDAWGYFAKEYGLEVVGAFEPSPGKEPSPQYVKALHDTAGRYNLKIIFSEPQFSSDAINPFVKDLKLEVFVLDPLGGIEGKTSYIELMRANALTIQEAYAK